MNAADVSMFPPPPGDVDLEAQASGRVWHEFDVGGLVLWGRVPSPRALHVFSMATSPHSSPQTQVDMTWVFLRDNLHPDSVDAIMSAMLDPDTGWAADRLGEVIRAVATLGTARPFKAVAQLAASAVHHWRLFRARLILAGIADPLAMLPDMHAVLDVVEDVVTDGRAAKDVASVHTSLYRPEPGEQFDVAESDPSFDAFMEAASGFQ